MKAYLYLLIFWCLSSCAGMHREILGNGFYKKHITVENDPGHWEKYAHHEYYYFKGRKLGRLNGFTFSIDNKYAVYYKSEDGKLYVFNLENEVEHFSGLKEYCYPSDLDWSISGFVRMRCLMSGSHSYQAEIDLTSLGMGR